MLDKDEIFHAAGPEVYDKQVAHDRIAFSYLSFLLLSTSWLFGFLQFFFGLFEFIFEFCYFLFEAGLYSL